MTLIDVQRGVTIMQARVLINATEDWKSGTALNNHFTVSRDATHLAQLVSAGFLFRRTQGKRTFYKVTPAGREFATYLERMEHALESH